ncbi:Constitutive coactivator of PPAR-gamma-like protein 2, partial [Armadillidium vulgare]
MALNFYTYLFYIYLEIYYLDNNYHVKRCIVFKIQFLITPNTGIFSKIQLEIDPIISGSLETKEFILDEIAKGLNLPRNYFCFLATLLGNYLLSEDDLHDFYGTLIPGYDKNQNTEEELIRAVVKFITNNCDVNNLLTIGAQIFCSVSDPRVTKFKESVQYFLNGTKDGFLRYKPLPPGRRDISMPSHFKQHDVQFTVLFQDSHSLMTTESHKLSYHPCPL